MVFRVILLTNPPTNQQKDTGENVASLVEVKKGTWDVNVKGNDGGKFWSLHVTKLIPEFQSHERGLIYIRPR